MTLQAQPSPIQVKHRRKETTFGQIEIFTAILPTGRIVGQVELQIPLEPGFTIEERSGKEFANEIREAAEQLARRIAESVERPRSHS